jgi:hypothetical protein
MIARWKGIVEVIHFGGTISKELSYFSLFSQKRRLGPQNGLQKLKTAKNSKLPKLPENIFEPVGKGGWPPISTWINPPS